MTPWTRRGVLAAGGLSLAGCSVTGALNALAQPEAYEVDEGIPYGEAERQRLDVYRPANLVPGAPMVVFFYGGSWKRGKRAQYRFVGEALASAGIVTIVADYRLIPEVRWRAILQDCAAATHWALANAARLGASPQRVHLMGHSAGAYNAAMLALDPRWLGAHQLNPHHLAGWIGIAGPYRFPIDHPAARVAFEWPDTPEDSQPLRHVSRQAPRTLLLAAAEDEVVPASNSVQLASLLQGAGVPVRLQLLKGVNHITVMVAFAPTMRNLAPVRKEVIRFVAG